MDINMRSKFGEYCTKKEQGEKLADLIKVIMESRDVLNLDFCTIRIVSTDFLESAFFDVTNKYMHSRILKKINLINIKKNHRESVIFTLEHLNKYHRNRDYKTNINKYFNKPKNKKTNHNEESVDVNNTKSKLQKERKKQIAIPSIDNLVGNITVSDDT